ncbi:kinase-like domain-containing protein [Parachaetomium inaequale]|uniref:Kinase-like domain-containing protein n=1 Tax=Parachaetomium inaequale TaxID=2588326 RepID=A0AAN6PLT5_9PEZI|nr:kinase-like domain-containing protein [Parachaetomium inaequale]
MRRVLCLHVHVHVLLVGSKHVLRHIQGSLKEDCLWENSSDGLYYTLSIAPIHDAGDVSAVFSFSDTLIIKAIPKEEKEHIVTRVSEIYAEIKVFRSSVLTGRVEVLQQHCKELGIDCSVFVLSYNDLGPTNIIVNGNRIIVQTKFAIYRALCIERVSSAGIERNSEYLVRVEQKLGEIGFPEVTEAYNKRDKAIEEE